MKKILYTAGLLAFLMFTSCKDRLKQEIEPTTEVQSTQNDKTVSTAPSITSVTGVTSTPAVIVNGKWTGQPANAPSTASNAYKGWYAVECNNNTFVWTIRGKNFPTNPKVYLLNGQYQNIAGISSVAVIGTSTSTQIRILVTSNFDFQSLANALLIVTPFTLPAVVNACPVGATFQMNIVGVIQTRGFGQCTWEVAYQRRLAGKSIPTTAYTTNTAINRTYVPQRHDCLQYGTSSHVSIITSIPTKATVGDITTYTFTVTERNADWNETRSTSTRHFRVNNKTKTITQGIGTNASSTWTANGCFR